MKILSEWRTSYMKFLNLDYFRGIVNSYLMNFLKYRYQMLIGSFLLSIIVFALINGPDVEITLSVLLGLAIGSLIFLLFILFVTKIKHLNRGK